MKSQRNEWTFPYKASDVLKAVEAKVSHHTERLSDWKKKEQEVMERIKEDGIEVHESLGAGMAKNTSHYGAQVIVKSEYQRDLDECHAKVKEHTDKLREFKAYAFAFELNPQQVLDLTVDDINFFFSTM